MLELFLNEYPVPLRETPAGYFAICVTDTASPSFTVRGDIGTSPCLRPTHRGMSLHRTDDTLTFEVPNPAKTVLDLGDNRKPLFLFTYLPEEIPVPSEHVRVLSPGVYDTEQLTLSDGDTLYLTEGAVLRGLVEADFAENVTVCGRGILDVSQPEDKERRAMLFRGVRHLTLRDITVIGSCSWCIHLHGCKDVTVDSANILSWRMCGDGIDIVGSSDVTVRGIFARTADDCIALKATGFPGPEGLSDVRNVTVRDSVLWNAKPGNGIEIGFETRCEEICDILFENLDIVRCEYEGWQSGGAITIHNGDRAVIHDVVYRDIRIERAEEKLFDFKVQNSQYSRDDHRGRIEHILVENISVTGGALMPSILQGHTDPGCMVAGVTFRNIRYKGRLLESREELPLIAERCAAIFVEGKPLKN